MATTTAGGVTMITLYNKDCMEALKEYPDGYFDCAIVDPPYGIGYSFVNVGAGAGKYGFPKKPSIHKYKKKDWDNRPPDREYFVELKRVSKHQIIFGANHFIDRIPDPNTKSWIIWHKKIACKNEKNFSDCELAYTTYNKNVKYYRYDWNGVGYLNNPDKQIKIHPTEKPYALYRWILQTYCKKGDRILDTHLGSGSIAIAVHDLGGFDLVGYELDTEYYTAACKRLKEYQRQLKLFEQV